MLHYSQAFINVNGRQEKRKCNATYIICTTYTTMVYYAPQKKNNIYTYVYLQIYPYETGKYVSIIINILFRS